VLVDPHPPITWQSTRKNKKTEKSPLSQTTQNDLGKSQGIPMDRKLQRSSPGKIRDKENQSKEVIKSSTKIK
jgi:hypothetical protein